MKPVIGISIGDINGIGPEVILKSLKEIDLQKSTPVIFSPVNVIEYYKKKLHLNFSYYASSGPADLNASKPNIINIKSDDPISINPGLLSVQGGTVSMKAIEMGIGWAMNGHTHALVTAPLNKEEINLSGYHLPGHTEFLAEQTNTKDVLMMLISGNLRVALATTHLPIKYVAESITEEVLIKKLTILQKTLIHDFGISAPQIAVLGLNPHAGDGGIIGFEELEIIKPTISKLKKEGLNLHGPYAADGFFGHKSYEIFDAILAMYHDQGLAPFKLLAFGHGINYTAGLPIIRTSPDHGTAYNIAGKGLADPSSFIDAYNLAVTLAHKKF